MGEQPNILLIMCDQLNAGIMGCYGGPVPTPNLDRLASEGLRFTNASTPCPACSPARATILTGLYPHGHGITYNCNLVDYPDIKAPPTEKGLSADDETLPRLLHAAGWQTHHYGKWHLSGAGEDLPYYADMFGEHHEYADIMAETFEEVRRQAPDTWLDWYGWALPVDVRDDLRRRIRELGDDWGSGKLNPDWIAKMGRLELPAERDFDVMVADRTIERLANLDPDRPFMVTCSFNRPHDPFVTPSPYYEQIDPDALPLPDNFESCEPRFRRDWSRRQAEDIGEFGVREFRRCYGSSVRLVDDQIGRVLDALEQSGRAENTIVVFTADHGDMCGGHGMLRKSTNGMYDELMRVPCIIRWPGRLPAGDCGLEVALADLAPTLLGFVGAEGLADRHGCDMSPYLLGRRPASEAPPYRFGECVWGSDEHDRDLSRARIIRYMVRGRGMKYFAYIGPELRPDDEYLFDLIEDPGETRNVVSDPARAGRLEEMRRAAAEWLEANGSPGLREHY